MIRTQAPTMIAVLVAALWIAAFAAPLHAGVIDVTNTSRLIDTDGDNLGNSVGNTENPIAVGEPGNQNENNEGRMGIYFAPSAAERTAIAANGQVFLTVWLHYTGGDATHLDGFDVDLLGFEDVTYTDGETAHYQFASTTLLQDAWFDATDATTQGNGFYRTIDVTSFVKTEAARSATSTIVFRLQADPDTLPIDNNLQTFWVFNAPSGTMTPYLTLIPEPASLSTLAVVGAVLLRRRR